MITVEHLTKRYGEHVAVDDVSFRCEPGTVTGFLGPNGAGKSTTMRMICGLTPPTRGGASILGVPYRRLANPGRHVGVLLDAAAQHAGRSGRETLSLCARLLDVDRARVEELLTLVGLSGPAARRRVGGYSFGMRQRLGVAQALLGDPAVLILDEPTSGLDPEGVYQMRTLLRGFADRGGTVLLSSHQLREIEAVADRIVMIAKGRVVADGAKDDLLTTRHGTRVAGPDPVALRTALIAAGLTHRPAEAAGAFLVDAPPEAVGRAAAHAGVALSELRPPEHEGLEEMFLSLIGSVPQEIAS
ncbi:ABC transporter ATP-binding protein [Embleya scabrispora]|uniref:ABC transporter ATP-binding protein n=1 Tax=Embleya scabrispora TaxID=159449 RepID=UPI00036330AB|nr:ATP-binding cassette domain-containing protein [Embleya scabrispora]MYS84137.1 ATP-binding cassette domain-containing protein [Streptomyces sp. SID5474]